MTGTTSINSETYATEKYTVYPTCSKYRFLTRKGRTQHWTPQAVTIHLIYSALVDAGPDKNKHMLLHCEYTQVSNPFSESSCRGLTWVRQITTSAGIVPYLVCVSTVWFAVD
ncbi:hypothetical protein BaRGS_00018338 [Batillaria attramentaria]|uniref:Uncharacterized protein n=1 Tax=Batillaria attramentaria TaxID=370345 RepID=A0ABD0KTY5_9CAEN